MSDDWARLGKATQDRQGHSRKYEYKNGNNEYFTSFYKKIQTAMLQTEYPIDNIKILYQRRQNASTMMNE